MDSPERLHKDVERLATPQGRMVGTAAHDVARDYLIGRLAAIGVTPYDADGFALAYEAHGTSFTNVIGIVQGTQAGRAPVLLGAHYDTAGVQPGADDNAAAVAIVLQVAGRLRARAAERDVVIALFDAEEPPHFHATTMGSTVFYEQQAQGPVHAAIILDLVGHEVPVPGAKELLFVTGMETDPQLERTIRALPTDPRLRVITALNRYVGDMSDHHTFRLSETPYLFFSCGRWQHYHQVSDTPDRLAYDKMAAIVDLTEAVARDVAGREFEGPWEGYDTTETDLELLRDGLGPIAASHGLALRNRADIERLVSLLTGRLGL